MLEHYTQLINVSLCVLASTKQYALQATLMVPQQEHQQ
jgi:hypothetical protein